jgi:hypothetical protein
MACSALPLQTGAAVATAKVTVRVVPASAIHASQQVNFSLSTQQNSQTLQAQTDTGPIAIRSADKRTPVIIKVEDEQHKTYDLSISSESTLTGSSSSDTITISNMKFNDNESSSYGSHAQQLYLDGELTLPDGNDAGSYTGTTEITVNYN